MDTIEQNGLFYKLSSEERTNFVKNDMYYKVLPGDSISYTKLPNGDVVINDIIDRQSRLSIGILDTKYKTIRLPIESKTFKIVINKNTFDIPNKCILCLVLISINGVEIIREYGDIKSRVYDLEICKTVYSCKHFNNFEYIYNKLYNSINKLASSYRISDIVDQTSLNTFNIDPTHSLDFDDAISVDIPNRTIYIHIVDIHTGLKDTGLEHWALELGQTLYLPEGNYNIFPADYSEDKFSLIKGQDRNVITVEIKVSEEFAVSSFTIYRSIINIKHRYDYQEAQNALENGNEELVFLDKLITNGRWKHSKFNFPQRNIVIKNNYIESIEIQKSFRVNKIIEALMIGTNVMVTHILVGMAPQRFHQKSLGEVNIDSNGLNPIEALELLKTYKSATYSNVDSGHYALGLPQYTHFTSPIRRGFDILVHNMLAGHIYGKDELSEMIAYLNYRDKLNTKIVEFYDKCKLLSYFETYKKQYKFTISNVLQHGIQIYVDELVYLEFIHVSKILPNVRWNFEQDGEMKRLVGGGFTLQKLNTGSIIFKNIDWQNLCVDSYIISL
jgi:exoribonuclease R